nr:uncharacterized protein LOC128699561 [Cherax quadricarinatus]
MNLKRLMSCLLLVGTIWCIVLSMSSHSLTRLENLVLGLLAGFSASYIVQLIITCYNSSHKGEKEIYCENKAENPTQTAREETIQDMDEAHFFTQLTDNTIKESSWTTVAGRNRRIKNNKPNKNELNNNKTYANTSIPKATYYKPTRGCKEIYCENKEENPTRSIQEETIQDMDDVHFLTQLTDNTIKESSWTTVAGRNSRIKNNKPNKNELNNNKTYANTPKPKVTYYKPDRVCEKVEVAPDLRKVILGSGGAALTQFTKTY